MIRNLFLFVLVTGLSSSAAAENVFFIESFDNDAASFFNAGRSAPVDHVATGGADGGGFVRTQNALGSFAGGMGSGPVIFRAEANFNSSDRAFQGDYLAAGVEAISFDVRHDVVEPATSNPIPVTYFLRISTPSLFPAVIATSSTPVLPSSDFTEVSFDLTSAFNPEFTFEGPPAFETIFSNVGNLQYGVQLPAGFTGDAAFNATSFTFDLDEIVVTTAVPEPSTLLLGLGLVAAGAVSRRRRDGAVRHG